MTILAVMIPAVLEFLGGLLRWLHLASAAVLVGGFTYARFVAAPASSGLEPVDREGFWVVLGERFRPLVYLAIAGLIVSGVYTLFMHPGHTRVYEGWFGVKMLFAAHAFAAAVLTVRTSRSTAPEEARRLRRMTGIVISGMLAIFIAALLRRIY
jgi:uncharacterized membrane protein